VDCISSLIHTSEKPRRSRVEIRNHYYIPRYRIQPVPFLNPEEIAAQLTSSLELNSVPAGVKFFENVDGTQIENMLLDKGFEHPLEPLNTCQLVAIARIQRKKVFATRNDMACVVGAVTLGLIEEPEVMKKGYLASYSRKDLELAAEFTRTIPRVRDRQVSVVAFSPLGAMPFEPDVIVIYGNSLQVMKIIASYLWDKRGRVEVALGGEFSVCGDVIAKTHITNRLQFSIPCSGERASAGVSDNELSVGIPGKDIVGVCEALMKSKVPSFEPGMKHELDKMPYYFPNGYLTLHARKLKSEMLKANAESAKT